MHRLWFQYGEFPPPLEMGGGGDIRIVLSCTLIFYGDVINYPYV